MITPEKILYTASAKSTGGRDGRATSSDGILDVAIKPPKELGGPGGATNPEQLFAAGYSACFTSAVGLVARHRKVNLGSFDVTADVSLGAVGRGYGLSVKLTARMPEVDRAVAQEILDAAHQVCPYSNATRGNIPVVVELA